MVCPYCCTIGLAHVIEQTEFRTILNCGIILKFPVFADPENVISGIKRQIQFLWNNFSKGICLQRLIGIPRNRLWRLWKSFVLLSTIIFRERIVMLRWGKSGRRKNFRFSLRHVPGLR